MCTHQTPPDLRRSSSVRPGTIDGGGLENNALRRQSSNGQVEPDTSPRLSFDRAAALLPVEVRRGAQGARQPSSGDQGTMTLHCFFVLQLRANMGYVRRIGGLSL